MRAIAVLLAFTAACFAADTVSFQSLIDLSKKPDAPEFQDALVKALHDNALDGGTAWIGEGTEFLWAVRTPGAHPSLEVDGKPRTAMKRVGNSDIWFATGSVTPAGKLHLFEYKVNGKQFGGNTQAATTDYTKAIEFPVFGPDSYAHPGVPQGKLSEKLTFTSKIYEGMTNDYWIYVPAQYDPNTPAALMVWQDGQSYNERDNARTRMLDVLDNLIAQKKIPVMIGVFISPGTLSNPDSPMYKDMLQRAAGRGGRGGRGGAANSGPPSFPLRSIEYDTVDDRYARYLRDEILPEVYKKYNIRRDAYSRAITGLSSGRIWLQDGLNDLENNFGSWPLQNIQMANSFKLREYDFHFSFGGGTHNPSQGSAEFPAEMIWLWRDYDPAKTEQTYTMDEAEKTKPFFRVI